MLDDQFLSTFTEETGGKWHTGIYYIYTLEIVFVTFVNCVRNCNVV